MIKEKLIKEEPRSAQVNVRIPKSLYKTMKAKLKETKHSWANVVIAGFELYLEEHETKTNKR